MTLVGYGEDRLVSELTRGLPRSGSVRVGVGDDCAVIGRKMDDQWRLLKTDCIIEGVHFLKNADARKVGWKALARPLSDIAAMGGLPECALITIAAATGTEVAWLLRFYEGIRNIADRFQVSVVGGETARSPDTFFCSVAVTGFVEKTRCVTRAGGRPGDSLYVTGRLGGSINGKHLTFIPRIEEARWLTRNFTIHAMMDLSDGLQADLPRLADASRCGFELDVRNLPVTRGCSRQNALSDGEDYELLFATPPDESDRLTRAWKRKFPALLLTCIGTLNAEKRRQKRQPNGFDHFA